MHHPRSRAVTDVAATRNGLSREAAAGACALSAVVASAADGGALGATEHVDDVGDRRACADAPHQLQRLLRQLRRVLLCAQQQVLSATIQFACTNRSRSPFVLLTQV